MKTKNSQTRCFFNAKELLLVIAPCYSQKVHAHSEADYDQARSGLIERIKKLEHDNYVLKKCIENRSNSFHSEMVGTPNRQGSRSWDCDNIESGSGCWAGFCGLEKTALKIKSKYLVVFST